MQEPDLYCSGILNLCKVVVCFSMLGYCAE